VLHFADLSEAALDLANLSEAALGDSDLSEAQMNFADLSGAKLTWANLSDAVLSDANLSEANLRSANLSNAALQRANMSRTNLVNADLSNTDLFDTDLSLAKLGAANLSGAHLAETDLTDSALSRATNIDAPNERITSEFINDDGISKQERYDIVARANHELRSAYSANGLLSQARNARVRERRARRKEARAGDGWQGTAAWFGSLLSKFFTGYGVQLKWISFAISLLYLSSAGVYFYWGEMSIGYSLYYSVVTFTTAPPETPQAGLVSVVAGIETFAGTAAIVFLGYVLGTRERV